LGVEKLVNIVLMGGDDIKVVRGVEIFGGLAKGLVDEFLCQILFADFSFPLKFKGLANLTSHSTLIV